MKNTPTTQSGFSLVEMIVSLGVFSIVITIAVGALLVLIASNEQLQGEQSVMTNLSFALDSMSREMRTGTNYYCETQPNYSSSGPNNIFNDSRDHEGILNQDTQDCEDGLTNASHNLQGVSFYESGDSITAGSGNRILYFFDNDAKKLFRRVGNGNKQSIVSEGIVIESAEFFVTGSDPLTPGPAEDDQPVITVLIEAVDPNDTAIPPKKHRIQTSVTQRTLDL